MNTEINNKPKISNEAKKDLDAMLVELLLFGVSLSILIGISIIILVKLAVFYL